MNNCIKISISTLLLILSVIIIFVMVGVIYKVNNEKSNLENTIESLQEKVTTLSKEIENIKKDTPRQIEGKYVIQTDIDRESSSYIFDGNLVLFESLHKEIGTYIVEDDKVKITYRLAYSPEGQTMELPQKEEVLTINNENTLTKNGSIYVKK